MRTEKYKLERALIELESIVEDLVRYVNIRKVFDDMFEAPMNQLQELMPTEHKKEESKWN